MQWRYRWRRFWHTLYELASWRRIQYMRALYHVHQGALLRQDSVRWMRWSDELGGQILERSQRYVVEFGESDPVFAGADSASVREAIRTFPNWHTAHCAAEIDCCAGCQCYIQRLYVPMPEGGHAIVGRIVRIDDDGGMHDAGR